MARDIQDLSRSHDASRPLPWSLCKQAPLLKTLLSSLYLLCHPVQELMRAKAFYCGDDVQPNHRIATRMAAGTGAAPGQAPPDLPSLLLDGRICYIGMPVRHGMPP